MINLNNIFSLFENKGESSKNENNNTFIDFTEDPGYYIGMWKKIILNKENIIKKFSMILIESGVKTSELSNVREGGEYFLYDRAWKFLNQLDINFDIDNPTIKPFVDKQLFETFDSAIDFFSSYEEYEICAFIVNIKKKLELKFGEAKEIL